MTVSSVKVHPATEAVTVDILTEDIGSVEVPVYIQADEEGVLISQYNQLPVDAQLQRTAFGDLKTSRNTPQVQIKFPYNLNTEVGQALYNNAASTVVAGSGVATVTCAGAASAFSQIRTRDIIRYGSGQGAEFLGSCAFTAGVANSSQVLGCGDDDEGFFFGYDGVDFGVLHRRGGSLEIKHLKITAGADGTGGTFTITLDGTAVTITVQANDTISEVVAAIVASTDFWNAGRGWEVGTPDNIRAEFLSLVAENAVGSFSFSDVDSGVTAGTFNQATTEVLGVSPTETWISQTSWSHDKLDGTTASGVNLDQTKLNVYGIDFQYLGAGAIEFNVENPSTGLPILVHRIKYANTTTIPSLDNPSLHLTLIAKTESGYSGPALIMKTASMAGFIQGDETLIGVRHSAEGTKPTTGTTPVNILAISNNYHFQGLKNKISIYPDFLTIASEAGKTVKINIHKNPTQIDGAVSLQDVNTTNSVISYDTAGTTVVGGENLTPFLLGGAESKVIDLKSMNLSLRPNERWSITASLSSGSNAEVTVGLTWLERL